MFKMLKRYSGRSVSDVGRAWQLRLERLAQRVPEVELSHTHTHTRADHAGTDSFTLRLCTEIVVKSNTLQTSVQLGRPLAQTSSLPVAVNNDISTNFHLPWFNFLCTYWEPLKRNHLMGVIQNIQPDSQCHIFAK